MFWKLLIAFAAIFHPGSRLDTEIEHEITPYGPQTTEELVSAREAIHGDFQNGDMMFSEDFIADAGIKDTKYRWPGYPGSGVVPYVISPSVAAHKSLILDSMAEYHKLTCIKFVPRTNQKDYIYLVNVKGKGCASYVGRIGQGKQNVLLGKGCGYKGTIIHELGHAVGLYHEHQRSDRDTYLTVYDKNVQPGAIHNFDKTPASKELIFTPYDYTSIMHYGNKAFSKPPYNLITMVAKNGTKLEEPYNKPGFTNSDIVTINKLYKC